MRIALTILSSGRASAGGNRLFSCLIVVATLLGICAALTTSAHAAADCDPWAGKMQSVQGRVEINRTGTTTWRAATVSELICPGDQVRVGRRSLAYLVLPNQATRVKLDQDSTLTFTQVKTQQPTLLDLLKGAIHVLSRTPRSLTVRTRFVNAAIEGTEFVVRVEPDAAKVWVLEGRILASNQLGKLRLTTGEAALAERGKAPVRWFVIKPKDAVQWALYYPPIIDFRAQLKGGIRDRAAVRGARELYRKGELAAAFDRLDEVSASSRSSEFYLLRAGMLLSVGRVDEAQADSRQVLRLDPNDGRAYALQAIVAVTLNENQEALRLAERAVEVAPKSAVPHIAMSYVLQALFDIEAALQSVENAVRLAPEDALAWARLAELELASGFLERAMAAAKKAAEIDPNLARTQTIMGFAELAEIEIESAKKAFENATELNPTDPLPHLGLGLAMIREGDLDAGTEELETAAVLDPNNSLIRSYLGKAYYEQKRIRLARAEFQNAKQLDPKDPTPWFLDAILKQTENQPVEALFDLQRSIELNDNRAVFRSRMLLDQDLAVRSARLGRIYNDLNFQQLGLLEGWKSLNTDPSNYSAHRLLADNYAAIQRHEIARVSELLQSQLLQPININPIQPQLAESKLLTPEIAGPADVAFNEYAPMFARNRVALQAAGIIGNEDTWGNDAVVSALRNKFSLSLGQFHFETDGFRENNDIEHDIYNIFAQVALSPRMNVQAEYRYRETKHGDLAFNFDLDDFDSSFRRRDRTDTLRLGAHYSLNTQSDIIASVIHQDAKDTQTYDAYSLDGETDGYIAEGQYLLHGAHFNLEAGTGYYDVTSKGIFGVDKFDTQHFNSYLYAHWRFPSQVSWTLGASYDDLNDGFYGDFNKLNPKFGLTWELTPSTTVRMAALSVLKRSLVADQTLEPTQVAGFNQFVDDIDATRVNRYGIAIDQKFSWSLYGGIEVSRRDLEVPVAIDVGDSDLYDTRENLYRAYLNWAPYRSLALSLAYEYEDYDSDELSDFIPGTDTHIAPLSLAYFHPSRLFTKVVVSYVNQELDWGYETESDQFTLVDWNIGYRLPKRYGVFSLGINNLFDKRFSYQGLGFRTSRELEESPAFLPERTVVARVSLSF